MNMNIYECEFAIEFVSQIMRPRRDNLRCVWDTLQDIIDSDVHAAPIATSALAMAVPPCQFMRQLEDLSRIDRWRFPKLVSPSFPSYVRALLRTLRKRTGKRVRF